MTRPEDAQTALELGADRIGIISCPQSPRNISPARMIAIANSVPNRKLVLVVADKPLYELLDLVEMLEEKIGRIQFHGSESPELLRSISRIFPDTEIVRCIHALDDIRRYDHAADRFLLEPKGDLPGGNGKAFDWRSLGKRDLSDRFILAGGLNAENVLDALEATGAKELDLCSGAEESPGIKSRKKMEEFINIARNKETES